MRGFDAKKSGIKSANVVRHRSNPLPAPGAPVHPGDEYFVSPIDMSQSRAQRCVKPVYDDLTPLQTAQWVRDFKDALRVQKLAKCGVTRSKPCV
ncbi:hypothetical protein So717_30520 [Roseobacter cerasinus]|uniref:Uncharacterized protein n=1 Tax=Roseobacter cerasinus TaxID=2602289 RepID=A0A640VTD9_9RHOB|nr:hypothetical protein So717_30520 [Roseobacter cerasinus]